MKTANLNPPGAKALDIARGRVGKRAGTPGSKIADAQGNEVVAPDQLFIGAQVSGEDGEQAIITINGTGQQVTNDSGADLNYGDVVVQNADGSVTTTTTPQDTRPIGVVQVGGGDGTPVSVAFSGYVAQINTTASVTAGNYAETSTVAGEATENATPRAGSFGRFLATGSNPPAILFGQTYLTGGGTGGGGGVPSWFNVKDYGALGDGVTDDTAAIDAWITAFNAAGGGVLYAPATPGAGYATAGGHGPITGIGIMLGDGMGAKDGTAPGTAFLCTSQTADLFDVTSDQFAFRDLGLVNVFVGTPSAGTAIRVDGANLGQKVDYDSIAVTGFYVGIDIEVGAEWQMTNTYIWAPVLYGVRIQNTVNDDAGDWAISDSYIYADTYNATSGIRIESAGGGKIVNTKVNDHGGEHFTNCIDLTLAAGTQTSVLTIVGCSLEGFTDNGLLVKGGSGSRYRSIIFAGNQVGTTQATGPASNGIKIDADTAGDLQYIVISSSAFVIAGGGSSSGAAVLLTKADRVTITGIRNVGFAATISQSGSTNIQDFTGGVAAGVAISGTPSSGQVPIASSGTAAAWGTPSGYAPGGAAGGDLSGTYPNPSVTDDSHAHTTATLPVGAGTFDTDGLIPVEPYDTYSVSGTPPAVTITTKWGIAAGVPYYDSAGAVSGEEAALFYNPTIDEFVLIAYGF